MSPPAVYDVLVDPILLVDTLIILVVDSMLIRQAIKYNVN